MATRRARAPRHESNRTALVDGLVQLSFEVQGRLGKIAGQHDLSLTQVRLLGVLRDHEPGIQELADHLGLEKSSVSGLVDRAEARGLVHKTSSIDDGRAVQVAISKQGLALAQTVERDVRRALMELVAGLTTANQARLAELLVQCVPWT